MVIYPFAKYQKGSYIKKHVFYPKLNPIRNKSYKVLILLHTLQILNLFVIFCPHYSQTKKEEKKASQNLIIKNSSTLRTISTKKDNHNKRAERSLYLLTLTLKIPPLFLRLAICKNNTAFRHRHKKAL